MREGDFPGERILLALNCKGIVLALHHRNQLADNL